MNTRVEMAHADELTDWYQLNLTVLRHIYEAATAGKTGAATWPELTLRASFPDPERQIVQHAYQEAKKVDAVLRMAVEVAHAARGHAGGAGAGDKLLERLSLEQGGTMHAIVQAGGLKSRATLHGALALDDATAVVYRGGSRVVGTAFLVGRDLLVTAAHVVFGQDADAFQATLADDLSFSFKVIESNTKRESMIAYPAEKHPLVAYSLPWGAPPNRLAVSPDEAAASRLDFALIRLDRAISHVNPVDIARPPTPAVNEPLLVLGFPGGTSMRWDTGVIDSIERYRLKHRVNALPGMSGSCCIDVDGRPVAMHEGSLADNTFSVGGHQGKPGVNRAVCLRDIRHAMLAGGKDPLAKGPVAPGIAIYSELLVAQWARSGLRLAPPGLREAWGRYVKQAVSAEPEQAGPFRPFHPWFRRLPFEQWIDRAADPVERLCIVSGAAGTGKSFLAEIVRAKANNAAEDVIVISATETTSWSWREAMQKWGIAALPPPPLRPHAGIARHDHVPAAAERIASFGGRTAQASPAPLFVLIDFDGNASFRPGEEAPWLPFMADLLGYWWVRLVVLGAPGSIIQELLDTKAYEAGLVLNDIELKHLNAFDFRPFARSYLPQDQADSATLRTRLDAMTEVHTRMLAAFPEAALQTVATVLAAILLQNSFGA